VVNRSIWSALRDTTVAVDPGLQVSVPIRDQASQSFGFEELVYVPYTRVSPPTVNASIRGPARCTAVTGEPVPPVEAVPPLI